MRGLTKESSNLPLTSGIITCGAKAIERPRSREKSIVVVEPSSRASPIVAMLEHFFELRTANDAAHIAATWGCGTWS